MFATPGLDSVFLCVCFCGFGRLFLVSNFSFGFSVVGFHSSSLSASYILAGGCALGKCFSAS
ncbi:hypothetical protein HID58_074206, partial [Brassica napus]